MDNKLNAFVLTPTHKHQFLSNSYPECESTFSAIENARQKKQKLLKIPQEKPIEESDDDDYLKAIKTKEKEIQTIRDEALKNYESEEKNHVEIYENTLLNKLQEKEIKRQIAVENTFFNPKRTINPKVKTFAEKMMADRYSPNGNISGEKIEFNMNKQSARALITAEKTVMQQSIHSQWRTRIDEDTDFSFSLTPPTSNPQNKMSGTQECIKYGNRAVDEVNYDMPKESLSPNHQGNYFLAFLGSYSNIGEEIKKLIGSDNIDKSKTLAEMMLNLIRKGEPITEAKLKPIGINQKELFKAVGFLTKLCVNFYKEAFRRSSPAEKKHKLPYAVGQARGLLLAKEGTIHLLDLFDPISNSKLLPEGYDKKQLYGAPYGIATTPREKGNAIASKDNVEKVEYKLRFINSAYNKSLLEKMEPEKKFPGFLEENRAATISTRKQIHRDLLAVYGGENDTDGEGYSSDESYADFPGIDIGPK